MSRITLLSTLCLLVMVATATATTATATAADAEPQDALMARLERGNPIPEGTHRLVFPNMAKQTITFTSRAEGEMIAGYVQMGLDANPLGEATINATEGTGEGEFAVNVAWMRTGIELRDSHLRSPGWLNADAFPSVAFRLSSLERLSPTVYRVQGTWGIHGVERELSGLANIRFIPAFPRVGENVVVVNAHFDIDLNAFGLENPGIGSVAVARVWQVEVALLGLPVE